MSRLIATALAASLCAQPVLAKSLLPGVLYEIDPALPASTEPLGATPAIQLDANGDIVAMKLAGSGEMLHRGFGSSALVPHGLDGHPVIANPPGGAPGGWESLVFNPTAADPIAARPGQPFTVEMVARRRAAVACDVVKLYAKSGPHAVFSYAADGTMMIGQNNGRGTATEAQAAPLHRWDIVYYIYDGRRAWLLRNGERTAVTPDYVGGGFGEQGAQVLQGLNGCAMDVAWMAIAAQAPSVDQLNAETARLHAAFPSVAPQSPVVMANMRATSVPLLQPDQSASYLTTPNNPLAEPLPVVACAVPGNGLVLQPGARNAFSLIMGGGQPGANMTTAASIRDRFYMNYMVGSLEQAIGSPMDTGQPNNNTFAAVARHYRAGDPNDLHVMESDGMHLRAICSRNHTDCRPGHVWGAMVRLPFEWRPGMTMKVRYRSPKGDHAWAPIWMYSGQQTSPGPDGRPYDGFGKPEALYRTSTTNFEIDWNDNYSRFANGVPTGHQIDFGTPDDYGTAWKVKPHGVYWANGNGWTYYDKSHKPEFEAAPFDWSGGFHDLVGNWRGDGSNLIDLFVDGSLVSTVYMDYPQATYVDPKDGQSKLIAMHLIIGNQAIPGFSRGAASAKDNDGLPDGWTIVVQEISGWYGNVAEPEQYRAAPQNGLDPGGKAAALPARPAAPAATAGGCAGAAEAPGSARVPG